jgi:hypothetical protein
MVKLVFLHVFWLTTMLRYNLGIHSPINTIPTFTISHTIISHSLLLFLLRYLHCVYMSQNQGDAQLKNECEKKKVKSTLTWHDIEYDGSVKKSNSKVPVYSHSRLRRRRRTCYFGPQLKAGTPRTVKDNPIDLSYEEMSKCNDL